MNLMTVSEVARQIETRLGRTIPPRQISDLFYSRRIDDSRCPVIGRNRVVPVDFIPVIEQALLNKGAK